MAKRWKSFPKKWKNSYGYGKKKMKKAGGTISRFNPLNKLPIASRKVLGIRLGDWVLLGTIAYFVFKPFQAWVKEKIFKK